MRKIAIAGWLLFATVTPASAHKLIEPGPVIGIAKGSFSATATSTWNRLQQKEGKFQEIWTIDGDHLNRVIFLGGVPDGEPLLTERDKKRDPLPKFAAQMLLPDIPVLFERTYRSYYGTPVVEVGAMEPVTFAGEQGIRFEYGYTDTQDEVERRGEAFAVVRNKQLFMIAFEAPKLYYFERDVGSFHALARSVKLAR